MVSCWAVYAVSAEICPGDGISAASGAHSRQYDLQPARYRILMKGVEIGSGDLIRGAGWRLTLEPLPGRYLVGDRRSGIWPECYLD